MSTQGSAAKLPPAVHRGLERAAGSAAWGLAAFRGRLAELSGAEASAALTLAVGLVVETQRHGEPAAWVSPHGSSFYPPDVAAAGVDLDGFVVVWAQGMREVAQASDLLLRSGAFGLVALDLSDDGGGDGGGDGGMPLAVQTRLAALAKRHETALICLTRKGSAQPSLGSLFSLRAEATRTARIEQRFRCEAQILKDKRHGPGWTFAEVYDGPDGLC